MRTCPGVASFLLSTQPQQPAGIPAENRLLGFWRESQSFDLSDRVSQTGRKRIITANHQPLGSIGVSQVAQQVAIVRDDVEEELTDVCGGWARNGRAAFRNEGISHIEPADQTGKRTTSVVENHAQSRMPFQHTTVDEQRG